jgi:XRE family transcriptional regulator, fatty acid utilization regulator
MGRPRRRWRGAGDLHLLCEPAGKERAQRLGPVMLKLFEVYGVDWRDIAEDDDTATLADLRAVLQDPLFEGNRPDLPQLRAAQIHSPDLVAASSSCTAPIWRRPTSSDLAGGEGGRGPLLPPRPRRRCTTSSGATATISISKRAAEASGAAQRARRRRSMPRQGAAARPAGPARAARPGGGHAGHAAPIRRGRREVLLSEALDHPNRVFQLVHVAGLIEHRRCSTSSVAVEHHRRCTASRAAGWSWRTTSRRRADALRAVLAEALASKYDFDHLATRFGVSFEQACHRATTLQRSGRRGCRSSFCGSTRPATSPSASTPPISTWPNMAAPARVSTCTPRSACRDGSCRSSSRCRTQASSSSSPAPSTGPASRATRRTCAWPWRWAARSSTWARSAMPRISAASPAHPTPIGINCRICPRLNCDQRAHNAIVLSEPLDERRRGTTRYAS